MSSSDYLDGLIKALKEELRITIQYEVDKRYKTPIEKEWYNLKEVYAITGISPVALKGRKRRGTLKLASDGNILLMSKDELKRLKARIKLAER